MNFFFLEYIVLALAFLCFGYNMLKAQRAGEGSDEPPEKGGLPTAPSDDEMSSSRADAEPTNRSGRT